MNAALGPTDFPAPTIGTEPLKRKPSKARKLLAVSGSGRRRYRPTEQEWLDAQARIATLTKRVPWAAVLGLFTGVCVGGFAVLATMRGIG